MLDPKSNEQLSRSRKTWIKTQKLKRKGIFRSSYRQSTRHKPVDPGQYPYRAIVAAVGFFRKSWSFLKIHLLLLLHELYNSQSLCRMHKIASMQMLRFARLSQFDGAQLWIVLFIVTTILSEITWCVLQFTARQFIRSFGKFSSFRTDICKSLILNPKKQNQQTFYESYGAQRFQLEFKV